MIPEMQNTITIDITSSNNISIPFEWITILGLSVAGYVQITLVDDKIVIHKPIATDVKYERPCKVGDNSYIRSLGLFNVLIPKQLLAQLGIEDGGKADLILEENCISIRRNTDVLPEIPEPEPSEPIMAFCCICGCLLYTDNGLVKVLSKHICHECIEVVKSL